MNIILDLFGVVVKKPSFLKDYMNLKQEEEQIFRKKFTLLSNGKIDESTFILELEEKIPDVERRIKKGIREASKDIDKGIFQLRKIGNLFLYSRFYSAWGEELLKKGKILNLFSGIFFTDLFGCEKELGFQKLKKIVKDGVYIDDKPNLVEKAIENGYTGIVMIKEVRKIENALVCSSLSQVAEYLSSTKNDNFLMKV